MVDKHIIRTVEHAVKMKLRKNGKDEIMIVVVKEVYGQNLLINCIYSSIGSNRGFMCFF